MSGSSLDGLDIAHVQLEEVRGQWSFSILHADCIPYSGKWITALQQATSLPAIDFVKLHTAYGRYLGEMVNEFTARHDLVHQVHFIASHGHTVFHEPAHRTTCQIGDGAPIAAIAGLPVINDLRAMDVALGGQGAPIVPIGDKLLFGGYDYLLNIGGIANVTIQGGDSGALAFDICPANQVLNLLAEREGKKMDEDGAMAASGKLLPDMLEQCEAAEYYRLTPPKSLSNESARNMVQPILSNQVYATNDLLHTATIHIATQIAEVVAQHKIDKGESTMLITGGGAFNSFLVATLQQQLAPLGITIVIPDTTVVMYKEALVMALIGALRWREEVNVLSSVTGASRDSVGGALWLP